MTEAETRRPTSVTVWALRVATVVMMLYALVTAARKFRATPEQEELTRYAELTVPAYLEEVAQVEARLDRLRQAPGPSAAEARALLVDEVMPLVIRAKKHASAVLARSEAVKASNAEYQAALDRLIEVPRAAVRAIDDPALSGEEGYRQLRERRREADEALRAWMMHLRERCAQAGLSLGPTSQNGAEKKK